MKITIKQAADIASTFHKITKLDSLIFELNETTEINISFPSGDDNEESYFKSNNNSSIFNLPKLKIAIHNYLIMERFEIEKELEITELTD